MALEGIIEARFTVQYEAQMRKFTAIYRIDFWAGMWLLVAINVQKKRPHKTNRKPAAVQNLQSFVLKKTGLSSEKSTLETEATSNSLPW